MPTSTYTPLLTYTTPSTQSTYTFTSIPTTYTDLELVITVKGSNVGDYIKMRVGNGTVDAGTNYSYANFYASGNGGSMGGGGEANKNFIYLTGFGNMLNSSNTGPAIVKAYLFDYSNTTTNKRILSRDAGPRDGASQVPIIEMFSHSWRSTSAINTIELYASSYSFPAGCVFTLYGIKAGS